MLLFHEKLDAATPAELFATVTLGDAVLWEARAPIPGPAKSYSVKEPAPQTWPVGTTVRFHVRNHGFNSYKLISLFRAPR